MSEEARPIRVMVVYGTRPEAIKMAPLVLALQGADGIDCSVVVTGQHREMLDQVNEVFGITPDLDLDIFQAGQTLGDVTTRTLEGMAGAIASLTPDAVLVQGDTTTTFAAALAAFYARVPVIHTEAGLRTDDKYSPFPEEINRRLTTQLADLHLAPTKKSRANLLRDGVHPQAIQVTGNSVIDALLWTVGKQLPYSDERLAARLELGRPTILVTAHRRESWGEPMQAIGRALATIAHHYPDHDLVFPVHRNPLVREAILPHVAGLENVIVTEPLPYGEFCQLMARSTIILTDSGGVQEEGPSLGKPVLVMRENTERPEAVEFGTVKLVGTDEQKIIAGISELIEDADAYATMAYASNPYGDGRTAERTVQAILHHFGRGEKPQPFIVSSVRPGATPVTPSTPASPASPAVPTSVAAPIGV